jgi:hypothetical protein
VFLDYRMQEVPQLHLVEIGHSVLDFPGVRQFAITGGLAIRYRCLQNLCGRDFGGVCGVLS